MRTKDIEKIFIKRCEEYAKELGAINTQIDRDKRQTYFSIFLSISRITFVYRIKESEFDYPSTLYARIHLKKNRDVFFHIPELLSFLGIKDFRAFCFPYIENEKRLNACFDALTSLLNDHWNEFENIVLQGQYDKLQNSQKEKLFKSANIEFEDSFNEYEQELFQTEMLKAQEDFEFLFRYTIDKPYYNFCLGKLEKAEGKYARQIEKGKATDYEKQLYEFIKKSENAHFKPMPEECFAYRDAQPYLYGVKGLPFSLRTFALSVAVGAVVFTAIVTIINYIITRDAIVNLGADWWVSTLFGAFTGIFISFLMPTKIKRFIKDKKAHFDNEFMHIVESQKWKDISMFLVRSVIAISLTTTILLCSDSIRLYDTYGEYPKIDKLFGTETFQYEDIDKIYYMNARHNVYGDRIDRPSYVFVINGKVEFDFDGYTSVEKTEELVIPLIEKYNIEIIKVDSNIDIPEYEEYFEENY